MRKVLAAVAAAGMAVEPTPKLFQKITIVVEQVVLDISVG